MTCNNKKHEVAVEVWSSKDKKTDYNQTAPTQSSNQLSGTLYGSPTDKTLSVNVILNSIKLSWVGKQISFFALSFKLCRWTKDIKSHQNEYIFSNSES